MRVTVDTNVLVRVTVKDDPRQAAKAIRLLKAADTIAVPIVVFCEFAWVLRAVYRLTSQDIASAIQTTLDASNVNTDRMAAEAGLAVLRAGGDFADGVIAHLGLSLGGEAVASFDQKAVALLKGHGMSVRPL